MLPGGMDVEIEIKVRTRLNISSYVAKQRANVCLMLHGGQSFSIDEPVLQVGNRIEWLVPVWLAPPEEGRRTKIGELHVDAQTGEVVDGVEQCRMLKAIATSLLQATPPVHTPPRPA
jgi:hypothetical protein